MAKRPPVSRPPPVPVNVKLVELQTVCVKLLASMHPLTMATTHVDDRWLDELRHVLIRQGVEIKSKVK